MNVKAVILKYLAAILKKRGLLTILFKLLDC